MLFGSAFFAILDERKIELDADEIFLKQQNQQQQKSMCDMM